MKIWTFSATQVDAYKNQCQRKWGWDMIDRIPRVQKPSQIIGTSGHSALQGYFEQSKAAGELVAVQGEPQIREMVYAALPHFPDPRTEGVIPEGEFKIPGFPYGWTGAKDVVHRDYAKRVAKVYDFKTTSDFKYIKTCSEMLADPQAGLYAWHELLDPRIDTAEMRWVYSRTKGANAAKVSYASFTRAEIRPVAESLAATAQEMYVHLTTKKTALELPFNARMCTKFGGCQYAGKCNLPPQVIAAAALEEYGEQMQSMPQGFNDAPQGAQDIAALLSGAPRMQSIPMPATAHPPSAPPPPMQIGSFAPPGAMALQPAPLPYVPPPAPVVVPEPPAPTYGNVTHLLPVNDAGHVTHALNGKPLAPEWCNGFVPGPQGQPISTAVVNGELGNYLNQLADYYEKNRPNPINPPEGQLPQSAQLTTLAGQQAAAASAPPEEVKKGRGRPKKETTPPAPTSFVPMGGGTLATQQVQTQHLPTQEIPMQQAPHVAPPAANPAKRIGTLYINCTPLNANVADAGAVVAAAQAEIAKAYPSAPDYRLFSYGAGAGLLCSIVSQVIDQAPSDIVGLTISTASPDQSVVLSVLRERAQLVVQGL